MMKSLFEYSIAIIFILIKVRLVMSTALSNKNMFFTDITGEDIADYISAKKYIPNEKELLNMPLIKNTDSDSTYILSRLSDEELIQLLNEKPHKNEFELNDIVKIGFDIKANNANRLQSQGGNSEIKSGNLTPQNKRFHTISNNADKESPYFKLNHNPIDIYTGLNAANYMGFQKLQNLFNIYKQSNAENNYFDNDNEGKKELLFNILVAQLKSLCCKKSKISVSSNGQYNTIVNDILPSLLKNEINIPNRQNKPTDGRINEYMFLIINDEIKSSGNDKLISVDPESLDVNSSVLLLGPVTTHLSDEQLKLVMNKISNVLAKPEYLSLLQQLSKGDLIKYNKSIMKNFVFGRETRRYIKPHRCNYQSKLAKVYGGPKWIICTGYLNLNKPSLYD